MKPGAYDPLNHSGLLSLYEIESRAAEDALAAKKSAKKTVTIPMPMTPEEREEMDRVCRLIQDEKDHQKFSLQIARLIEILGRKEHRLEESDKTAKAAPHFFTPRIPPT
jgi:hypothetical protein